MKQFVTIGVAVFAIGLATAASRCHSKKETSHLKPLPQKPVAAEIKHDSESNISIKAQPYKKEEIQNIVEENNREDEVSVDAEPGDNPNIIVTPRKEYDQDEILAYEENIKSKLKTDREFSKIAEILDVKCNGKKCKILMESTSPVVDGEDPSGLMMTEAIKWLEKHPEFGNTFEKHDLPENNRAMFMTLYM